jgi:hypothetical protein
MAWLHQNHFLQYRPFEMDSNLLELKRFSSSKEEQLPQLHLLAHMLQHC